MARLPASPDPARRLGRHAPPLLHPAGWSVVTAQPPASVSSASARAEDPRERVWPAFPSFPARRAAGGTLACSPRGERRGPVVSACRIRPRARGRLGVRRRRSGTGSAGSGSRTSVFFVRGPKGCGRSSTASWRGRFHLVPLRRPGRGVSQRCCTWGLSWVSGGLSRVSACRALRGPPRSRRAVRLHAAALSSDIRN